MYEKLKKLITIIICIFLMGCSNSEPVLKDVNIFTYDYEYEKVLDTDAVSIDSKLAYNFEYCIDNKLFYIVRDLNEKEQAFEYYGFYYYDLKTQENISIIEFDSPELIYSYAFDGSQLAYTTYAKRSNEKVTQFQLNIVKPGESSKIIDTGYIGYNDWYGVPNLVAESGSIYYDSMSYDYNESTEKVSKRTNRICQIIGDKLIEIYSFDVSESEVKTYYEIDSADERKSFLVTSPISIYNGVITFTIKEDSKIIVYIYDDGELTHYEADYSYGDNQYNFAWVILLDDYVVNLYGVSGEEVEYVAKIYDRNTGKLNKETYVLKDPLTYNYVNTENQIFYRGFFDKIGALEVSSAGINYAEIEIEENPGYLWSISYASANELYASVKEDSGEFSLIKITIK